MAQQNLILGTAPNDNTGEALRASLVKVQSNFDELYAGGTNVTTEMIQDTVGAFVNSGTNVGITITYDDVANTLIFVIDGVTFTSALETKLNGIATGATANDTDANLRSRSTHTGTQTASTISDFDTEVTNNISVLANSAKNSYPSADATKLAGIENNATADQVATSGTGTAIPLDNVIGYYGNMTTPNTATTYTTTGTTLGAWGKVRINAASQPTVTGATLISGATFVASTDMYMVITYNGNIVEYYFLAI